PCASTRRRPARRRRWTGLSRCAAPRRYWTSGGSFTRTSPPRANTPEAGERGFSRATTADPTTCCTTATSSSCTRADGSVDSSSAARGHIEAAPEVEHADEVGDRREAMPLEIGFEPRVDLLRHHRIVEERRADADRGRAGHDE